MKDINHTLLKHTKGFILLLSVFIYLPLSAQLLINTSLTPLQLVQNVLVGGGVTVSNVTMTGLPVMYGSFTNGSTTNLGFDQGVLLTTGQVTQVANPVTYFMSTDEGQPGDSLLQTLTTNTTYDACILEFDFVPTSDTVRFRYVFGSEEYPEFVCSMFNDVFGFFISGPNPSGPPYNKTNLALIPCTTLPVEINTVNQGPIDLSYPSSGCISTAYASLFVYNQALGGTTIAFDGFTVPLTAWAAVVPCQKYHIKLAVSDVGDGIYDSGVFLEANSFGTNGLTFNTTYTSNIDTDAIQGCNSAIIHFVLNTAATDTTVIHFNIGGTATNGVNYITIPDSIYFAPGQDSTNVTIIPINDTVPGPPKTVILTFLNSVCGTTDTILIKIKAYEPMVIPFRH